MELSEDDLYKWYKLTKDGMQDGVKNMQSIWDSRNIFPLILAAFSLSSAQQGSIFDVIGKEIGKDVSAVKRPIEESLVFVGFSQCKHVKRLVGVSYKQLEGENEPDLDHLTLVYRNRTQTEVINITDAADWLIENRQYKSDGRLIIFLHGFTDNPTKDNFQNISNAFLNSSDVGILALDAGPLIRWLYLRSSTYVRFIGRRLAEMLAALDKYNQDASLIHLIGHSLGAHISGFAGKTFTEKTGKKIGRISGLDPAGPCFSDVQPELRLKSTDADFVDIIHTNAGILGIKEIVGHVDFFPNSGEEQPDCLLQPCSHSRCVFLFAESITNPKAFPAVRCKDWDAYKKGQCEDEISYMGYPIKPGTTGQYFLQTSGEYPFGLEMKGTRYINNEGIIKSIFGGK